VSGVSLDEAIRLNHAIDISKHFDELPSDVADELRAKLAEIADRRDDLVTAAYSAVRQTRIYYGLFGWVLGAATGAFVGYKFAYSRAQTKYAKIADDEIAEMREHYQAKAKALESEAAKRPVDEIVKERGYSAAKEEKTESVSPPMAVPPPAATITIETEEEGEEGEEADPLSPEMQRVLADVDPNSPMGKAFSPEARNIFKEQNNRWLHPEEYITHEWNYHEELKKRSPDIPYVIHYDEKDEMEYQVVTVTYYDGDNVMCDEHDSVIDLEERNRLIGEANLNRFGHGSNSPDIVYVRNDTLELVYEVVRSPNSYAETVHGFSHDDYSSNLERMRVRERDDPED